MRLRKVTIALLVSAAAGVGLAGPASARAVTGTEYFLLLQTNDGPVSVVANGPIHAAGKDVVVSDTRDRFVFPKGKLIIDHHPVSNNASFDPVTCLSKFTEHGTYTIVRGTGAYEGVSGHGKYFVKFLGVGCDPNKPPVTSVLQINASGPITLP